MRRHHLLFPDLPENIKAIIKSRYGVVGIDPSSNNLVFCIQECMAAQLAELARSHDYALTLVTATDTPWTPDGLQRESEEVREMVHRMVLAELNERGSPFVLIEGDLPQRLRQVERALEAL